jgi:hypothetical protein
VSFETFTAMMFQVEVFWVVTPCSIVVRYQHCRGPCCLHLQGEVAGMGKNGTHIHRPGLERSVISALASWKHEENDRHPVLLA